MRDTEIEELIRRVALESPTTTRDRQLAAIAAAHLAGDRDRVEALVRDHLIDHPPNAMVTWILANPGD